MKAFVIQKKSLDFVKGLLTIPADYHNFGQ